MTTEPEIDEENEINRINEVMARVSKDFDGESMSVVAVICCLLMCTALQGMRPKQRAKMQSRVYRIMISLIGSYK
jgi:hypothetical protein